MKFLAHYSFLFSLLVSSSLIQVNTTITMQKWELEDSAKEELDTIFDHSKAQKIIQQKQSSLNIAWYLVCQTKRITEIGNIIPKQKASPDVKEVPQKKGNIFGNTLWNLLRHPLANPFKRIIGREINPLRRALSDPYFSCTPQGYSAFIFSENPILSPYILKLPTSKRFETAQTIQTIIEKLNLQHVKVPDKYLYRVPHTQEDLVIAQRIPQEAMEDRKLHDDEVTDIVKVLVVLDALKIPLTDTHNPKNIIKTKDACFLSDTESFWEIGSYSDYLPNTKAFLKGLHGDQYTLPPSEEVQKIVDLYTDMQ